jgi:hypothetical protein
MQEMDMELFGCDFCDIASAPEPVSSLSSAFRYIAVAESPVSCGFTGVIIAFREKEGIRCVRKNGYCWH